MIGEAMAKGRSTAVRLYRRLIDGEPDGAQDVPVEQRIDVRFVDCIPDGDQLIIRSSSTVVGGEVCADLSFATSDAQGEPVDSSTIVLGRTFFSADAEGGAPKWEIISSTRVARASVPFRLRVSDNSHQHVEATRVFNARRMHKLLSERKRLMANAWDNPAYAAWFKGHRVTEAQLSSQAMRRFEYEPLISIVVPLYHTPKGYLADMVDSVLAQSYTTWELVLVNASPQDEEMRFALQGVSDERVRVIDLETNKGIVGNTNAGIEAARGDYIAFLDHDDFIEPDALFCYVSAINDAGECGVLYCDEDSYTPGGRFVHPHFKPDFNRDLLYTHNYITHFLMIKTELIRTAGVSPEYVEGAQDYDLTLRAIERTDIVAHIPRVLYHWRIHAESTSANAASKQYAQTAGKRALEDHFKRRGIAVNIEDGQDAFTYIESYQLESAPLVSIIIPSKDHVDVLSPCLESIIEKATYPNYEIVVVENNSEDAATFEFYETIERAHEHVRVVRFEGPFNYSKVVNFGAAQAQGEYLLFLNNDTEVITPDFIERMLGFFARPEVGVVGAKLLHLDNTIQHAGVIVGPHEEPWHVFMNAPADYRGYMGRAHHTQDYLAVTGACQLVSRRVFDEVGGYDESFCVAYNDVDFCLRARESGYLTVYCAQARLYHREFTSRGRDVSPQARTRFYSEKGLLHHRWARLFVEGDPYCSPNCDRDSLFFSLSR